MLNIIRELQSIAQAGLTYTEGKYDRERYERLQELTAVIAATHTNDPAEAILHLFQQEKGYATPKIDTRGAVFKDNKILLVREIEDEGRWTLPGGWADIGDSPSTAVTREVFEESGYETKAIKLIAMLDREKHPHPKMYTHTYKFFFLCKLTGGSAKTSIETSEIAFFAQDEIPTDLSTGRVLPTQIDLCFAHHYDRTLATVFD